MSVQTKKCRERAKQEIHVGRLTNGHSGHVISALGLMAHQCARGHGEVGCGEGGGGGDRRTDRDRLTETDRHTERRERGRQR